MGRNKNTAVSYQNVIDFPQNVYSLFYWMKLGMGVTYTLALD